MSWNQSNIVIGGPAIVQYGGATIHSKGDITISMDEGRIAQPSQRFGQLAPKREVVNPIIRFTPAGNWADIALLFPYASMAFGSFITAVPNNTLIIWSTAGKKYTFHNVGLIQQPDLVFSSVQTLLGEVAFEAFVKNDTARTAANSIVTVADATFPTSAVDPADFLTQAYTAAWGATPFDAMQPKGEIRVSIQPELQPYSVDSDGIVSRKFMGLNASCSLQPLYITEAQLTARFPIQGSGISRGSTPTAADLNVTGTGVYVRIYGAILNRGPRLFAIGEDLVGDLSWSGTQQFATGAASPLFYVGTAAPT